MIAPYGGIGKGGFGRRKTETDVELACSVVCRPSSAVRVSRIVQWNHITDKFQSSTRQAAMRIGDCCLRARSAVEGRNCSAPQPRSSGRAGPAYQGSEIRSQESDPD